MGKWLIIVGIVLLVSGLIITYIPRFPLGRLPGDIVIERENFRFYLPITSSIIVSVILSLIVFIVNRMKN
ncbi:MAG TPA: DUF2905 domain-containing protein [Ohtaekwangia sp.]|nr:DUF2905 domain-containing protein [Ohtaekwangia sp.]